MTPTKWPPGLPGRFNPSGPIEKETICYIKYTSHKLRPEIGDFITFDGEAVDILNRNTFISRKFVATPILEADFLKAQQV